MMGTFKKFVKDRKLELCTEKSKVLVFNRKRKERKEKWLWGGKEIEKVQEFKYLGFVINNKGNYKEHIKELNRKGRMAVRKAWGKEYAGTILKEGGFYLGIWYRV